MHEIFDFKDVFLPGNYKLPFYSLDIKPGFLY